MREEGEKQSREENGGGEKKCGVMGRKGGVRKRKGLVKEKNSVRLGGRECGLEGELCREDISTGCSTPPRRPAPSTQRVPRTYSQRTGRSIYFSAKGDGKLNRGKRDLG